MKKLEQQRPAVAQPLHNGEKRAQADVPAANGSPLLVTSL